MEIRTCFASTWRLTRKRIDLGAKSFRRRHQNRIYNKHENVKRKHKYFYWIFWLRHFFHLQPMLVQTVIWWDFLWSSSSRYRQTESLCFAKIFRRASHRKFFHGLSGIDFHHISNALISLLSYVKLTDVVMAFSSYLIFKLFDVM